MSSLRFAAHAIFLALLSSFSSADGFFEVADLSYEVDDIIAHRPYGQDSYHARVGICSIYSCPIEQRLDLIVGKQANSIIFEQRNNTSWNGDHLTIALFNSENRFNFAFDVLNDHTIFLRHDWQNCRQRVGFFTVTFRHRLVCSHGFTGIHCNKRAEVPTTHVPPTTTSVSSSPSSVSKTAIASYSADLVRRHTPAVVTLAALFVFLLTIAVCYGACKRSRSTLSQPSFPECTSVAASTSSSQSSLHSNEMSSLQLPSLFVMVENERQ